MLSPRLQVTPYKGDSDPVQEARKLLIKLEEYDLVAEVVQAQFKMDANNSTLLFEMSTPLQAAIVHDAWNAQQDQTQTMNQVARNFFEPEHVKKVEAVFRGA